MLRLFALAALGSLALSACDAPAVQTSGGSGIPTLSKPGATVSSSGGGGFSVAPSNAPSGAVADTFARNFLNGIQTQSINNRAEYCGYFFVDQFGQMQATNPIRGTFASCDMPAPRAGQGIFASYHTHGAFDRGYDNEVPSAIDLTSDFQFGIDGYVSTPGGRVWLVDYQTRSTSQVCGRGCVISDANFPAVEGGPPVQAAYSLAGIRQRQSF